MKKCFTKQSVFSEISGCLVEEPECGYAHKFGFSFVCCHPDHTKFYAHLDSTLTKDYEREQYDILRRKRRDEFTATLDETSRKFFCLQTDFLGQPLTNIEQSAMLVDI